MVKVWLDHGIPPMHAQFYNLYKFIELDTVVAELYQYGILRVFPILLVVALSWNHFFLLWSF